MRVWYWCEVELYPGNFCQIRTRRMAARSMNTVIEDRLKSIYGRFKDAPNGCKVPQDRGSLTKEGYGRCLLRYPGHDRVNTTLHRAVYILEKRQPELIRNKAAGEISHRCGNKVCVQIDHLILESPAENCLRRRCHDDGKCYGGHREPCIISKKEWLFQQPCSLTAKTVLFRTNSNQTVLLRTN